MMKRIFTAIRRHSRTTVCASLLLLIIPGSGHGQATKPLKVNWSSNSAAYLALWMAQEQGYFEREGLTVEFAHILSTSRALQAVVAGDIDITTVDFGPLPVPTGLGDVVTAIIKEAYTGALGPVATGFRLETISIKDGTMTITGKTR